MVGLQSIVKSLTLEPFSHKVLRQENNAAFARVMVTEEYMLDDGTPFELALAEPTLLLQELVAASPDMQESFATAARQHPCSLSTPWSLALGFDEFKPGDKFSPLNKRKVMVSSFSFKELGNSSLCHDLLWVTALVIRSVMLSQIPGGWSRVLKMFLRRLFLGTYSLSAVGVPLVLHGQPFMLYARLGLFFSDADGLRMALDWRGAGSVRPCFKCKNVWSRGRATRAGHVDITCGEPALFKQQDIETLDGYVDLLIATKQQVSEGTMPATALKNLEKALGLNCNALGLAADVDLRREFNLLRVTRTDWMHDELQDGVFNVECALFLKSCASVGITFADWQTYLRADWQFPRSSGVKPNQLYNLFNKPSFENLSKKTKFKCKASELLSLYAMLRHYGEVAKNVEAIVPQKASFDAACAVIDLLLQVKRGSTTDAPRLAAQVTAAMHKHHRLHREAYGTAHYKPKHHLRWHVPEQILEDLMLIDMFVIERHHLWVKLVAEHIKNTGCYEKSLMSSLLTSQMNMIASPSGRVTSKLIGPRSALPGFDGATAAPSMSAGGEEISIGDVVVRGGDPGLVIACAAEGGILLAIVRPLAPAGSTTPCSGRYVRMDSVSAWPALQLRTAHAWYRDRDALVVLH